MRAALDAPRRMPAAHVLLLCATLFALPVQFPVLPGNVMPVDLVLFAALPFVWHWLLVGAHRGGGALVQALPQMTLRPTGPALESPRGTLSDAALQGDARPRRAASARAPERLPLFGALLLLLLVTGASSVGAPHPLDGLKVAFTEVYLYTLFLTFAFVLERASEAERRCLMWSWLGSVALNGCFLLAQLSPSVLDAMNAAVASLGILDEWRPSGLFQNCNSAAMFQLVGFVPLVTLRLPLRKSVPLGGFVLATVLATGSMGALTAFVAGATVAVALRVVAFRAWRGFAATIVLGLGVGLALTVIAAVAVARFPALADKFEYLFTGRAERSASGRLEIWEAGVRIVLSENPLFGIGSGHFARRVGIEIHNDFLGFTVERGLLGTSVLLTFMALVFRQAGRAVQLGLLQRDASVVVLPACAVAACIASLTHEVFHIRSYWLALAVLQAQVAVLGARAVRPRAALSERPLGPMAQAPSEDPWRGSTPAGPGLAAPTRGSGGA